MELTREQLELQIHTVNSLVINSDNQLELANELAKYSNTQIKEIKAKYKPQKQDLDKQKKEILGKEKDALKPYENAKTVIKSAIGDYMKKIKLEVVKEVPKLKGTHIRKTWKARIVDADKVPVKIGATVIREINMSVLNDIAKVYQGNFEIPGVEFYQEEAVAIR